MFIFKVLIDKLLIFGFKAENSFGADYRNGWSIASDWLAAAST